MSVLREELVKLKQVTGNLTANTMDLEKDFDSEAEALRIIVKEIGKAEVLLGEIEQTVEDRIEVLERNDDGAISWLWRWN